MKSPITCNYIRINNGASLARGGSEYRIDHCGVAETVQPCTGTGDRYTRYAPRGHAGGADWASGTLKPTSDTFVRRLIACARLVAYEVF